ncbi:MAG: TAXI family TRAP transporter solute-binding subunit [Stappiaceae bacterium]
MRYVFLIWRSVLLIGIAASLAMAVIGTANAAEPAAKPRDEGQWRQQVNGGIVNVVTPGLDCACTYVATDMASVLNDMGALRVLPLLTQSELQGFADILYLKGVDLSIVRSDVLAYVKRNRLHTNLDKRLRYITSLYSSEVHLIAGSDVQSVADLEGRKVNFDTESQGNAITAETFFNALGVKPEPVHMEQALALDKVESGEIAASVVVVEKPAKSVVDLTTGRNLRLLPIPFNEKLSKIYLPASLTHEDYPELIPEGQAVETIGAAVLLAVYNWDGGSKRYRKIQRFTKTLFDNIEKFNHPERHANWRDLDIGVAVPGWKRFRPAAKWIDDNPKVAKAQNPTEREKVALRKLFEQFLLEEGHKPQSSLDTRQAMVMSKDFVEWRQQQ